MVTAASRSWLLRFMVAGFILAAALVIHRSRNRPKELRGVPDLLRRLESAGLKYRVILQVEGDVTAGIYLCGPTFQSDPRGLARLSSPSFTEQWRDVVFVQSYRPDGVSEDMLRDWGEHGLLAQGFLFFGDPNMLAEIARRIGVVDTL